MYENLQKLFGLQNIVNLFAKYVMCDVMYKQNTFKTIY